QLGCHRAFLAFVFSRLANKPGKAMRAVPLNPTPQRFERKLVLRGNSCERDTIFEKGSDHLKLPECFSPLRVRQFSELSAVLHALPSSWRRYRLPVLTSVGIDLELLHSRRQLFNGGLAIEPRGIQRAMSEERCQPDDITRILRQVIACKGMAQR